MNGFKVLNMLEQGEGIVIKNSALNGDLKAKQAIDTYSIWNKNLKNNEAERNFVTAYDTYKEERNEIYS